ncbi:hypothetical protein B1P88_02045 [Enterococcus faecium]|nr:hypothetical protein B1P88_02045 [Enterococcus faecium]
MQDGFFTTSDSWCSISCPSVLAQKTQNMKNYFAVCFSNTQVKPLISQPLFLFIRFQRINHIDML